MKKTLYIIGTKALADMIVDIASRAEIRVAGFFDDTTRKKTYQGKPIIGPISVLLKNTSSYKTAAVAVAIGDNKKRATVMQKLLRRGITLPPLIDPEALVMPSAIIAPGCIVFAGAYIGTNVRIGTGSILFPHSTVTHHTRIGAYNFIAPGVVIGGNTVTGTFVKLGSNSVVPAGSTLPNNYVNTKNTR